MTTIELTSEYNTLSTFLELNDPRVEESKMNIVADEDGDLTLLTNDIGKDGQRFVEEVFLYGDRIETHPLVANKIRAGASAGTASAEASPVRPRFQPTAPFSDDDDDDDFAPPVHKSAKKNSNQDNTVGESESERTNVDHQSPKKGPPERNIIVLDDDEVEALPAKVASTKKPQSKATKTSTLPRKATQAARATLKTTLGKDTVDVDVDNDDDDLSRINRRSKKTRAK